MLKLACKSCFEIAVNIFANTSLLCEAGIEDRGVHKRTYEQLATTNMSRSRYLVVLDCLDYSNDAVKLFGGSIMAILVVDDRVH